MNEEEKYPYLASLREQYDERDLKDRFFLEELWKSLEEEYGVPFNQNGCKSNSFLHDWLKELIEKTPMSREDRENYIKEQLNIDWLPTWEDLVEAELVEAE